MSGPFWTSLKTDAKPSGRSHASFLCDFFFVFLFCFKAPATVAEYFIKEKEFCLVVTVCVTVTSNKLHFSTAAPQDGGLYQPPPIKAYFCKTFAFHLSLHGDCSSLTQGWGWQSSTGRPAHLTRKCLTVPRKALVHTPCPLGWGCPLCAHPEPRARGARLHLAVPPECPRLCRFRSGLPACGASCSGKARTITLLPTLPSDTPRRRESPQ